MNKNKIVDQMRLELRIARKVLNAVDPLPPRDRYNLLMRLADEAEREQNGQVLDAAEELDEKD